MRNNLRSFTSRLLPFTRVLNEPVAPPSSFRLDCGHPFPYQATPRDPLVLAGVVLAMAALGLLATWIPAQRALSVNTLILLRED